MYKQYEAVPAYVITSTLDDKSDADLHLVKKGVEDQVITDAPGVALINPGSVYQEFIAFRGVNSVTWNDSLVLTGVTRAVHGGAFHHQNGSEVYLDQGEQYKNMAENSRKEMLKRWLRTLTR